MKKKLIKSFLAKLTKGSFTVVYWDGETVQYGTGIPEAKLIFNRPLPLTFNLDEPVLALGEAYIDEIIDFEGSVEQILHIIKLNKDIFSSPSLTDKTMSVINKLGNKATQLTQKQNIQHHYDLGNDFFSLWLDETMSYSCAYFKTSTDSLYQAQIQKLDLTLKKLQLSPGEHLLDIGSGWGRLIIKAAQQYNVQALGITLSKEQYLATKERISQLGLQDRVEVKLLNYLELDEKEYQFDKIVSIGMFEHVGKENLPLYMEKVNKLLAVNGLSLLHTITGTSEGAVNKWIDKYIFPGGYVPTLPETIRLLPEYDFHPLHIENLRLHYAITLDRWYDNFCRHRNEVEKKFDRRFVRMWELYLLSCAACFRTTGLNVYQILFSKGLNNNLPLTMEHIYK